MSTHLAETALSVTSGPNVPVMVTKTPMRVPALAAKSEPVPDDNAFAYASGLADGIQCRQRNSVPSKFLLVAFDEYSLGFRAGYFVRRSTRR